MEPFHLALASTLSRVECTQMTVAGPGAMILCINICASGNVPQNRITVHNEGTYSLVLWLHILRVGTIRCVSFSSPVMYVISNHENQGR